MSAQTFETKYFRQPPVFAANFPGLIDRSATLDMDTIVGPDGTDANPLEADDVVKVFKLPQGTKIVYGGIEAEALDSGNTLTLDLIVTDGTTTKLIFDECTIGQAGGAAFSRDVSAAGEQDAFDTNSAIGFVTDNGDYYVALRCGVAPTTPGNDGIRVTVGYTMCTELDEGNRSFPDPIPS